MHHAEFSYLVGKCANLNYENAKNAKKRKHGVLFRSPPKWKTLVLGGLRLYHFNRERNPLCFRWKREKLVFPMAHTLGNFHLFACSSINTSVNRSSFRVQLSPKDSASFDVVVKIPTLLVV